MARANEYVDRSGWVVGKLTVQEFAGRNKFKHVLWKCLCECGNTVTRPAHELTKTSPDIAKSCGCSQHSVSHSKTHGMTGTPAHSSWMAMNQRCNNPSDPHKQKYYADVDVQEAWKTDFIAFYNHIGVQPNDGGKYTIDRIDNEFGYIEGNVRWRTQTYQARHKTLQERSRTGVNGVTLNVKNRRGWDELRYLAAAIDLNGKRIAKTFSVRKYGIIPAFAMACAYRKKMIAELNEQGAEYSASHGL